MEWVETTGTSVEEASSKALELLGVAFDDAEIDVVNDVKMGLFGRVRTEARVRARVKPSKPRQREDRRDKRRRGRPSGGSPGANQTSVARTPPAVGPENAGGSSGIDEEDTVVPEQSERPSLMAVDEVPLEQQEQVARSVVVGVLDSLELDGEVTSLVKDDLTIEISVHGEGLGILVGPKGAALAALQEITRAAVLRQTGVRRARVVVDVGDYRARRSMALADFTRKIVADVLESGNEVMLEPMNSSDRKVVHDTVNLIDGVSTRSEGEEPRRRVVISPT